MKEYDKGIILILIIIAVGCSFVIGLNEGGRYSDRRNAGTVQTY